MFWLVVASPPSQNHAADAERSEQPYTWRVDLSKTEPHWKGEHHLIDVFVLRFRMKTNHFSEIWFFICNHTMKMFVSEDVVTKWLCGNIEIGDDNINV